MLLISEDVGLKGVVPDGSTKKCGLRRFSTGSEDTLSMFLMFSVVQNTTMPLLSVKNESYASQIHFPVL